MQPCHIPPQTAASMLPAISTPDEAAIKARMADIDIYDTTSMLGFGVRAQSDLQHISTSMLHGIKRQDHTDAGAALSEMVEVLRAFSITPAEVRATPNLWERLFGQEPPLRKLLVRFEGMRGRMDALTDALLHQEHALLLAVKSLDALYARTLDYYAALDLDIHAGQAKIAQIDAQLIPALEAHQTQGGSDATMVGEHLRQLQRARTDLERRVHDLLLTRQVALQALPSIHMLQDHDKALIARINTTLSATIPAWEAHLATALHLQAAHTAPQAQDAARTLQDATQALRTAVQKGRPDSDAINQAHQHLLSTIQDSLALVRDGEARRAQAEAGMASMQAALVRAQAHTST